MLGLIAPVVAILAAVSGLGEAMSETTMNIESYARELAAEQSLIAYWPMDGSLEDRCGAITPPENAAAVFVDQPAGGTALDLREGRFIDFGLAPALDTPAATVELLFKLTGPPTDGNPCLLALRDDKRTRYSLHIRADLKALALWNGRGIRWAPLPEGAALELGRWYHLAVANGPRGDFRLCLDGAACVSDGHSQFNVVERNLPLLFGVATRAGMEVCTCQLDEVAIYNEALSPEIVERHVDALGWRERRLALARAIAPMAEERARIAAQGRARREAKRRDMLDDPTLFDRGEPRVYEGDHLEAIGLPVGGIGAGLIQMNGYAEPHIWQIFNNYAGVRVPHSFLAVRAAVDGSDAVTRALQGKPVDGLEPMGDLTFQGRYPFGWYAFNDAELPVSVELEVFSPLIPMDPRDSAIPCAIFNVTTANRFKSPVTVYLLGAQQNAVGLSTTEAIDGVTNAGYGGNVNEIVRKDGFTALHMRRNPCETAANDGKTCCSSGSSGDMTLAVLDDGAAATVSWDNPADLFAQVAEPDAPSASEPSSKGATHNGAVAAGFTLAPGEERTTTFVLTWYLPIEEANRWAGSGLMYTNWWRDSLDVARDVTARLDTLTDLTRRYVDTLYETNLPYWLVDRVSSQVAVLRSKTCYWGKDGYFGGWEGCCPQEGCCLGNCAHVWHYAQAHARLFPSLARKLREQAIRWETDNGGLLFRQSKGWSLIAIDGQCGEILGCYREYLCSAGDAWLRREWPRIRNAMDYAVRQWDPDGNGLLTGPQHNTLDCDATGTSSWLAGLYLAALDASARMADVVGDADAAARYRAIRTAGAKNQDDLLWNGEYYIQVPEDEPLYEYGNGCHIDQVLGEWWASQVDLDHAYPDARVRQALQSLFQNNFQPDFIGIRQVPRKFVSDHDAGMQMITWPQNDRPTPHTLYGDEVMTGFEYAAAATMMHYGLLREGFTVAKAIADRYDGRVRTDVTESKHASWGYTGNPFGDDECGKFYARAMSSWSLLTASQGFLYDGPAGHIGFAPVWQPHDHASFFTTARGWGLYTQHRHGKKQTARLGLRYGTLQLAEFVAEIPDGATIKRATVRLNGADIPVAHAQTGPRVSLQFAHRLALEAEDTLELELKTYSR